VHRTGRLLPGDNIVLVATASEHRDAAFAAAEFLMDYLKTSAPFWKRESGPEGSRWVSADARDASARARWKAAKDAAE
jgi:molybdopterin synthase catalytic subunit